MENLPLILGDNDPNDYSYLAGREPASPVVLTNPGDWDADTVMILDTLRRSQPITTPDGEPVWDDVPFATWYRNRF